MPKGVIWTHTIARDPLIALRAWSGAEDTAQVVEAIRVADQTAPPAGMLRLHGTGLLMAMSAMLSGGCASPTHHLQRDEM
jgi:hypothetical protein